MVPFAYLLYAVVKYAVAVPCLDQWDLVPLLDKMYRGELTSGDLWEQNNEHRIFFPKLIMLGLARLTGWNIGYELAADILLAVGIFAVIVWQIKTTERRLGVRELRWAIPASSVIVFSLSQYHIWLCSWNMPFLVNMLAVLGGIVVLAKEAFSWRRFTAAALLGIVATHSFTNGLTFWPIGLLILLSVTSGRPERKASLLGWLLLTVLTVWSYFWHYRISKGNASPSLVFAHPVAYAVYVLKFLGSYVLKFLGSIGAQYPKANDFLVGNGELAFVFGLAAMMGGCWAGWLLARWKIAGLPALLPYIGMSLYSIGSALVAGLGRLCLGTEQAASSRYGIVVVPLWTALVVLLILLVRGKRKAGSEDDLPKQPSKRRLEEDCQTIAGWLLVGVISLLTLSSACATESAIVMSRTLACGRARLLNLAANPGAKSSYEGLYALHENPKVIAEYYPILLKWRLSVFRHSKD